MTASQRIPSDRYLMIIGSMKSGTTSLFSCLAEHPQICPSRVKEPEWFSRGQQHGVDEGSYEELFAFRPEEHVYALEASTGYTKAPKESGVAKRIFAAGLRPKFIYVVRNPFERIRSHYRFMKQVDPAWPYQIDDDYLADVSDYGMQLAEYRQYFPRESFHIVEFEEMTHRPHAALTGLYEWLGLPVVLPKSFAQENATALNYASELPETARLQIQGRLAASMRCFGKEYGVDVSRWGFS